MGSKKFCRVAIGSDSIRVKVHSNFKVIVIAEKEEVLRILMEARLKEQELNAKISEMEAEVEKMEKEKSKAIKVDSR